MSRLFFLCALLLALSSAVVPSLAQEPAREGPANPALEEGAVGEAPAGWFFASQSGGKAALDATTPFQGALSVLLDATEAQGEQRFANLMQSIDAAPWRGERVRFRAAVRTEGLTAGSTAQMWLRVDRPDDADGNRRSGAFDNMDDRPIRAQEWAHYEIVLDVADDATRIALGLFVLGNGKAWLDDVSFEAVDAGSVPTTAKESAARWPSIDPRVQQALAAAERAPRQPFWTPWLVLPVLAIGLFLLGLWPARRPDGPEAPATEPGPLRWFALRFTILYWLLYCLPGPFAQLVAYLPEVGGTWSSFLNTWQGRIEAELAGWTARNVFGIQGELVPPNGSGDTTQGYLTVLNWFALALALAGGWTLVLRRIPRRGASVDLLRSYLRYVLAFAMLGYGLAKVSLARNQFPVVDEWRLNRTWGETSPMGVVWAFMGASRPYTVFAGLSEVLAALLLVWRRTAILGAFVAIGVVTNITLLNYCYDVPVKIYSTHLLAMGVLILVPDARRLGALLLRNRNPTDPGTPSVWRGAPWFVLRWLLKVPVLVAGILLPSWEVAGDVWKGLSAPVEREEAPPADEGAGHLLTTRGYRWINEVPFNR